jgi:hypothetical protein
MRNLNATSFEVKLEEWEYLDEWHTDETLHYVVAEEGEYELSCGAKIVVGTISDMHESWETVTFENAFDSTPIVLS